MVPPFLTNIASGIFLSPAPCDQTLIKWPSGETKFRAQNPAGTLLHFRIYTPDEFTQNAENEKLHAA
jgi:hypothetical protein